MTKKLLTSLILSLFFFPTNAFSASIANLPGGINSGISYRNVNTMSALNNLDKINRQRTNNPNSLTNSTMALKRSDLKRGGSMPLAPTPKIFSARRPNLGLSPANALTKPAFAQRGSLNSFQGGPKNINYVGRGNVRNSSLAPIK